MTGKGHISRLHLFAKNTDAPYVKAGFAYQELKTLETWLMNKINDIDEDVYCDYEEDIFQRDLKEFKSKFRQIKLYSSKNFSFLSEEIRKSIGHFFMLFVKGEYLLDDIEFVFETNTGIARKRGDNDSELLKEWNDNQGNLDNELHSKCVEKIKSITDEYIQMQYEKAVEVNEEDANVVLSIYKGIPEETWGVFVNSITWIFDGLSSDEAIKNTIYSCKKLIRELPYPLVSEDYDKVFDRLRGIISDKSHAKMAEERRLTNHLLDECLLSLGQKDDQIYLEVFKKWKKPQTIGELYIGEFYEILYQAKHCRRNGHLNDHSHIWLNYLRQFILLPGLPSVLKREAIYEIIWLNLRFSPEGKPMGLTDGHEELIEEYFSDFESYDSPEEIEDTHNLLTIVLPNQLVGYIKIESSLVQSWVDRFDTLIKNQKKASQNKDELCHLLEQEAFAFLLKSQLRDFDNNLKGAIQAFKEIKELLPVAPFYPISQLGNKIEQLVDLLITAGLGKEFLNMLEEFSDQLIPLIKEREGNLSLAKKYTLRGARYLKSSDPKDFLKVIDNFQKAKDLYYNEDAYEGYVLCVMNLAQFYSSIGMSFAAKYYSLIAIWFCIDRNDSKLYVKIPDAWSFLVLSDFEQGSWISALHNFEIYLSTRVEFKTKDFDVESDEMLKKIILPFAFILAIEQLIPIH